MSLFVKIIISDFQPRKMGTVLTISRDFRKIKRFKYAFTLRKTFLKPVHPLLVRYPIYPFILGPKKVFFITKSRN